MATYIFIVGHGKNKNGTTDPGAIGRIKKGENRYFKEDLMPAIKRHLPANSGVVIIDDHNVYDYKDLVNIVNKWDRKAVVVEWHYDSSSSESASGGHVIVHSAYEPDAVDLALRDVIKKYTGVRYEHKGHKGISGRDNLYNVNVAKSNNINYRLVELGFGTNTANANTMVNSVDAIAKDVVQALIGKTASQSKTYTVKSASQSKTYTVKSGDTLWDIAKAHGTSVATIKSLNGLKSDLIRKGDVLKLKAGSRTHTVKSGESLSTIGAKYGVKWATIASLNGIKSPYIIKAGQVLKY